MTLLEQRYKDISNTQKEILQIIALSNLDQMDRTHLVQLLALTDIKNSDNKKFNNTSVKAVISLLVEANFITSNDNLSIKDADFEIFLFKEGFKNDHIHTYIDAIQSLFPRKSGFNFFPSSYYKTLLRDIKYAFFLSDENVFISSHWEFWEKFDDESKPIYIKTINDFLSKTGLFERQSTLTQITLIKASISLYINDLLSLKQYIESLKNILAKPEDANSKKANELLIEIYIQQGSIEQAEKILDNSLPNSILETQKAAIKFLKGEYTEAVNLYSYALKLYRKEVNSKNAFLLTFSSIYYVLALFNQNEDYSTQIKLGLKTGFNPIYLCFEAISYHKQPNFALRNKILTGFNPSSFVFFFYIYTKYFCSVPIVNDELIKLFEFTKAAHQNNYEFYAVQAARLILELPQKKQIDYVFCEKIVSNSSIKTDLTKVMAKYETWETILESLAKLNTQTSENANQKAERVVWLVNFGQKLIQPILQTLNKKGSWSQGRNIALKKLKNLELQCLTQQDSKVAKTIEEHKSYYYGAVEYHFNWEQAISALIGHPNIFRSERPDERIEIERGTPELIVKNNKDSFAIEFSTNCEFEGIQIKKITNNKYIIIQINKQHKAIFDTFGRNKITIPRKGEKQIIKAISNLSSIITVQSDLQIDDSNLRVVETDSKIHIQLLPNSEGIRAELFVKPFRTNPPYMKPGKGGVNIIAEIKGEKVRTTRNIEAEIQNANHICKSSSELQSLANFNDIYSTDEPNTALKLLTELQTLADKVVIEWPQGEKFKIIKHISHNDMFMQISKKADWFEISGELKINENLTFQLMEFLDMIKNKNVNFIELKNGEFISLTENLRKQLLELDAYSHRNKNSIALHPLASSAIEELTSNLKNCKVDKAWKELKKKIEGAREIKPEIPPTLDAELREYQVQGYNWLSQMAAWGVGACLADDMGLGKTIQSIALLLQRAPEGPALIVGPASVSKNWISEIIKFAPVLNPIFFNTSNRQETLIELKPYDVLICTYGILQTEENLLTQKKWTTIILDEAQAIKNQNTKTSKAAMELSADFRLITTGTPIQNHLGELWNLFNFINKGLLGSLEKFNERYISNTDPDARKHLKKLIQPFMLRRTKNQVLDELPKKTEITIDVDLSEEELAIYEAVRRNALEKLENDDRADSQKHLKILAEITNLRQVCCSPKLILKESTIKSSKIEVFKELLTEIIEGGHKVLVFSQFVKFLALIKEELNNAGITYQYLDGSTPIPVREQNIKNFQAGKSDVFLISLRAGGLGLNLTAADYVIHLDPWWNPAIEDQASDRAHRIGQTRPVTVYRLVTKGVIEEKIIKLHHSKRNLADNILDGTDVAGKISATELLELIRTK